MSGEQKEKREQYKQKRNKLIFLQIILVGIVSIVLSIMIIQYTNYNKDYKLQYSEEMKINYNVYLKENDFYKEDYLPMGQSYISELIDYIELDLKYVFNTEENIEFKYNYKIESYLEINNGSNNEENLLYRYKNEEDPINLEKLEQQKNGMQFDVNQKVRVDFNFYNEKAKQYIKTYNPVGANCSLIIKFTLVNDLSFKNFNSNGENNTVVNMRIPLNVNTVKPEINGLNQNNGTKFIICENQMNTDALKYGIITLSCLDVLIVGILIGYILLTINHDISYSNKVKRIMSGYKSFIQKILNDFNEEGYQVLNVSSVQELLEIRETLQMPILMFENEDKTHSKFMIPTPNQVLYRYDIKVDNYNDLYKNENDVYIQSSYEEPKDDKEPVLIDGCETLINEQSLLVNKLHFDRHNYSFESKLILSSEVVKDYYYQLSKFVKSYGVDLSRSWDKERINIGRKTYGVFYFIGKKLCVALPLEPNDETMKKYRFIDKGHIKKYKQNPANIKITSNRKVKYVLELLIKLLEEDNVVNQNLDVEINKIETQTKASLIEEGLIKK